jgi:predicted RND superfamily exporter protein
VGESMAAQYLMLIEGSHGLSDLISTNQSVANIKLRVDDNASASLMGVATAARAWWAEHGPSDFSLTPTGIMYEFARAEDEIAYGQIRGLSLALGVISLILFAIFRWPRLAFVTLLPNALPLLVMFGAMGLLGIPLDAGTALIGGLALGIAVDDTIHISIGYSERIEAGMDARSALQGVYAVALPPIVCTTVAIATAFSLLGLSEFTITRDLGLVTSTIMLLCLAADVTLLAALLLRLPARVGAKARD